MPRLLWSPASPYSAKVRMAASRAGVVLEEVRTETASQSEALVSRNPLGKIPCIVTDDGEAIFDSRVITLYLDGLSKGTVFPRGSVKRLEAQRLEALADGICDCLLAHVYERRMRPSELVHQPWLDLQWSKATRALDRLAAAPPRIGKVPHAGDFALRACLGYLDLRFAGQWEKGRSKLKRWAARFDERFPDLKHCLPSAA